MPNLSDIARMRLAGQQITETGFTTPAQIVAHMGAVQAQDYPMAKWAIGIRLPGSTEAQIEAAVNKGEILRTHLLRPTWHFVSADDIYWLLELTAPHIKAATRIRQEQLGITPVLLKKAEKIMERALTGGKSMSREELTAALEQGGVKMNYSRSYHLCLKAELDGLLCSGPMTDRTATYALLQERVKKPKSIDREGALGNLAQRYFNSHGPATLQDYVWWSGLPTTDARKGISMIEKELQEIKVENKVYYAPKSLEPAKSGLYLIPAYDEYIISYRDREAVLNPKYNAKAVSSNGVFRPIIVQDGQVKGIWKRAAKSKHVEIVPDYFGAAAGAKALKDAAAAFGRFLDKEVRIK